MPPQWGESKRVRVCVVSDSYRFRLDSSRQAKHLPEGANVVFMGHTDGNGLAHTFASADIMFFPSRTEVRRSPRKSPTTTHHNTFT